MFGHGGRSPGVRLTLHRDGRQAEPEAFQWILPKPVAGLWINAKQLSLGVSQDRVRLDEDVYELRASEMGGPHLGAGGAIERNDRSLDPNEDKIRCFHRFTKRVRALLLWRRSVTAVSASFPPLSAVTDRRYNDEGAFCPGLYYCFFFPPSPQISQTARASRKITHQK